MGAGCTKDAKGGVVDLQNGNGPETPRSPAKAVVKTEGRIQNHFEWLWLVLCNRDVNHIYIFYLSFIYLSFIYVTPLNQLWELETKIDLICFNEFKMNPISWKVHHDQRTDVLGKDPETAGCPIVNYSVPASSPQERAGCTLPIFWVHDMPRSFPLVNWFSRDHGHELKYQSHYFW